MPFMGKDWRSPGEAWVKTESLGWQRLKLIESQLCHEPTTAGSWPPRCDYGQHMVQNCNVSDDSRDLASSPGSSDSGRGLSVSPSPSCSPEKLALSNNNSHNYLFPLAFSSPYGSYSLVTPRVHQKEYQQTRNNISYSKESHFRSVNNDEKLVAQENSNQMATAATATTGHVSPGKENSTVNQVDLAARSCDCSNLNEVNKTNDSKCDIKRLSMMINDGKRATAKVRSENYDAHLHASNMPKVLLVNNRHNVGASDNELAMLKNKQKLEASRLLSAATTASNAKLINKYNDKDDNKMHSLDCNLQEIPINPNTLSNEATSASNSQPSMSKQEEQKIICNNLHSPNHAARNAPFCPISIRTREVAIYNTISEAFYRLDFCNAVHDIRRFNYVCKLLHLMITQNLTSLSGCATKVLINMLEQIAREVSANKRNIHVLRDLVNELKMMIQKYSCWGQPIGSSQLWQQHLDAIQRISQMIDNIELAPSQLDSQSVSFNELPVEMIREIILRLNDYRDLINSARASPVMKDMILSKNVWERLCRYHFTEQQLKTVLDGYKRTPQHRRPVSKYVRTDSSELRKQSKKDAPRVRSTATTSTTIINTNTITNATSKPTPASAMLSGRQIRSHPCTSSSSSEEESQLTEDIVKCTGQKQNRAVKLNGQEASSSYVNRTRKIFDSKSTEENKATTHRPTGLIGKKLHRSSDSTKRFKHNNNNNDYKNEEVLTKPSATTTISGKPVNERQQQVGPPGERSRHELDWEDVFHQLRKRFDLKEEYADCLLLCRHCRCLFWKSIGHPCIESNELDPNCLYHPYLNQARSDTNLNSQSSNMGSSANYRVNRNYSQSQAEDRRDRSISNADRSVHEQLPGNNSSGMSVAALSRNFDDRMRNADRHASRSDGSSRDILRDRRAENNINSCNNNARGNSSSGRPIRRRGEDLVPKHVAISPQAFLKFFSL